MYAPAWADWASASAPATTSSTTELRRIPRGRLGDARRLGPRCAEPVGVQAHAVAVLDHGQAGVGGRREAARVGAGEVRGGGADAAAVCHDDDVLPAELVDRTGHAGLELLPALGGIVLAAAPGRHRIGVELVDGEARPRAHVDLAPAL